MYFRMARYAFTGDPYELARRAEVGMLPVFQEQPGFQSYSIVASDQEIISLSAWESVEQAEAANTASAQWVSENMYDEVELMETCVGEILLSTALGVSTLLGLRV